MKNIKHLLTKTTLSIIFTLIWVLIFYKLVREVKEVETLNFDIKVAKFVYDYRTPFWNNFFSVITDFGGIYLIYFTLIITFILLLKKYYSQTIYFTIPIVILSILNLILKNVVGRTRPQISQIIVENDFSFPSGHSSGATIFYLMLIYLIFSLTKNRLIRYTSVLVSFTLIILIMFSRIYLGVHYLTDVLAGFIESLIIFMIFLNGKRYFIK